MTKNVIISVLAGILMTLLITGCGINDTLVYEGKDQPLNDVEEILEARLEMENPNKDFDVRITNE